MLFYGVIFLQKKTQLCSCHNRCNIDCNIWSTRIDITKHVRLGFVLFTTLDEYHDLILYYVFDDTIYSKKYIGLQNGCFLHVEQYITHYKMI